MGEADPLEALWHPVLPWDSFTHTTIPSAKGPSLEAKQMVQVIWDFEPIKL